MESVIETLAMAIQQKKDGKAFLSNLPTPNNKRIQEFQNEIDEHIKAIEILK